MTLFSPNDTSARVRAVLAIAASLVALTLTLAPHASAATKTLNVNPATGKDANSGSPTSPLKTLTKALSRARAGDTIQLAGGNYSQSTGEHFSAINGPQPVVVPAGVAIRGNAGKGLDTNLFGAPNQTGLLLKGDATISEVSALGFGVGLQASQGTQTLSGMHFTGGGIRLTGSANTTLTGQVHLDPGFFVDRDQTIFKGPSGAAVSVSDQAQFRMTGGDIFSTTGNGDGAPNCDTTQKAIFASGSARVTLDSVLMDDLAGGALDLTGSSTTELDRSKVLADYDSAQCVPAAAVRTLDSAFLKVQSSTLQGNLSGSSAFADGIRALSRRIFDITGSRVDGFASHGIVEGPDSGGAQVVGTTLESNVTQFDAGDAKFASNVIKNSVIDNSINAIVAFHLVMRNTQVTRDSLTAVTITGADADLGTLSDPGLNVLQGHPGTGVQFDPSVSSGTIDAVGDIWDAGEQGANAFGIYTDPIMVTGGAAAAKGRNFTLTNPGQSINLGPALFGRLRLTPKVVHARAGGVARLVMSWTHPISWRQLRLIELRLYRGANAIGVIAVDPLRARVTARGALTLAAGKSRLRREGRTVTASLAIDVPGSLAGRTLRVAVKATDHRGQHQLEPHPGEIKVAG